MHNSPEQAPLVWDPFQPIRSAILERQARASDKIADRLRHEHLAGRRQVGDSRADMNSYARKIATDELAFASVNTTPDLEPERSQSTAERVRASDRPGRAIKCGEKPISRSANLASSVMLQNFAALSIEFVQQFAPSMVANGRNTLG
jgi:hypothetical protein